MTNTPESWPILENGRVVAHTLEYVTRAGQQQRPGFQLGAGESLTKPERVHQVGCSRPLKFSMARYEFQLPSGELVQFEPIGTETFEGQNLRGEPMEMIQFFAQWPAGTETEEN